MAAANRAAGLDFPPAVGGRGLELFKDLFGSCTPHKGLRITVPIGGMNAAIASIKSRHTGRSSRGARLWPVSSANQRSTMFIQLELVGY